MQDHRPALLQGALHCLVGICQLAGVQFMTRRVQTEAWPVLLHLMRHGAPQQSKPAYPSGDDVRAGQHGMLSGCCMFLSCPSYFWALQLPGVDA